MAAERVALSWVSVSSGGEAEEGDLVSLLSNPYSLSSQSHSPLTVILLSNSLSSQPRTTNLFQTPNVWRLQTCDLVTLLSDPRP